MPINFRSHESPRMNHTPSAAAASAPTRRAFVKSFVCAGAALTMFPRAFHAALTASGHSAVPVRGPVVSFYMDRPYLDLTGTAIPYVAPRGMRSGAPLAGLSEEAFRRTQVYV